MNSLEGEIKSVADLPQIPFTKSIKRNIQAAMEPAATSNGAWDWSWNQFSKKKNKLEIGVLNFHLPPLKRKKKNI